MNEPKNLISFSILLTISLAIFYISGWMSFLEFYILLALYAVIFYSLQSLWYYLRNKTRNNFKDFVEYFLYRTSILLAVALLLTGSFISYHTFLNPATLPLYTLTNWEKTVQFQTMSHIASRAFYLQVQANIYAAKQDDWVLFFEGVRPWTAENEQKFNSALWIDFAPWLYDNLSELYWVVAQDNEMFLDLVNNKDYNIDLSIDDIIKIYEEKWLSSQKKWLMQNDEVVDINSDVIKILSELNPRELTVIRSFNQAFLNFIIKNEWFRNTMLSLVWNQDLFWVIIDERNEVLADAIINSEEKNIFVIYWLMHFDWVYNILLASDTIWKITSTKEYTIITDPGE